MATAAARALVCPVCCSGFEVPKLLRCAHLVCHKCLVSWLETDGTKNGCPLCRVAILPADNQRQGDLASEVDRLPTDLATALVLESEKTLAEQQVCSCGEAASVFCLQCSIMFCQACAKSHARIPATKSHQTENLSKLTAEQLAAHRQVFCESHADKPTELFCTAHDQLICVLCVSTHSQCKELKAMRDVAPEKRKELRSLSQKLADREATVTAKINKLDKEMSDAEAKFTAMRAEVKTSFDDLQNSVEAQRDKLNAEIEDREKTYLAQLKSCRLDLENVQAALSAHKNSAERLAASAPDAALLGMMAKLKALISSVEGAALPQDPKSTAGSLVLRSAAVDAAKKAVAAVGVVKDSEEADTTLGQCHSCGVYQRCPSCDKPREVEGPGYAAVIKVGDRVQRGRDWHYSTAYDGSPPGVGTVTKVDADLKAGSVWVRWDRGGPVLGFHMGQRNRFVLKFAG